MKKKLENGEREKMLNQDRFGFSKEELSRYAPKAPILPPKNLGKDRERDGGQHKDN